MSDKFYGFIGVALIVVGITVIVALIAGFPLMFLWNWLMPSIFGLKTIDFWEAIGLIVLSALLLPRHHGSRKND